MRFLIAVLLAVAAAALWLSVVSPTISAQNRAVKAGMDYGRSRMLWQSGPRLQTSSLVTVAGLRKRLATSVPSTVRQDVNVKDLRSHYGSSHKFELLVLRGVYNSLPPDEGVEILGDVVVLVDITTDHVVLMTN